MQAIGFYLALPFIYLVSLLPFPVLYLLSDFVFVILYYGIGYRKKVVTENLSRSFPEKSEKEIAALRRRFYRHFSDLILETFKTLSISRSNLLKHCHLDEASLAMMNKFFEEKKSIIIVCGHQGNWEWGNHAFAVACKQPIYGIYHKLENKYFNRLIFSMRSRFGTRLIEMKNTYRDMLEAKDQVTATAFIADQTPPPESAYWTRFLNQDTPVYWGTEKIAIKLNIPVVHFSAVKIKRGYYQLVAKMLVENPSLTQPGEISELHTRNLEKQILRQPEIWLWSHRRWKHKRPA